MNKSAMQSFLMFVVLCKKSSTITQSWDITGLSELDFQDVWPLERFNGEEVYCKVAAVVMIDDYCRDMISMPIVCFLV